MASLDIAILAEHACFLHAANVHCLTSRYKLINSATYISRSHATRPVLSVSLWAPQLSDAATFFTHFDTPQMTIKYWSNDFVNVSVPEVLFLCRRYVKQHSCALWRRTQDVDRAGWSEKAGIRLLIPTSALCSALTVLLRRAQFECKCCAQSQEATGTHVTDVMQAWPTELKLK